MFFKTLKLKNFKSYGDNEVTLELDVEDITLIHGKVGAGKTTFFDAILWGIYGECLSPVEQIVNRITKKNCKVELIFEINQKTYSIVRYRNHDIHGNKILLFKGKENISMKNAPDTQRLILEIVQIPYKVMVSTVIFSSELYTSFLRSRPSDRLKIIDSIFSLKEVNDFYAKIKEYRIALDKDLNEAESNLKESESAIETRKKSIIEYKEHSKNALLQIKVDREALFKKILDLENSLKNIDQINVEEEMALAAAYNSIMENNNSIKKQIVLESNHIVSLENLKNALSSVKDKYLKIKDIDVKFELERAEKNKQNKIIRANIDQQLAEEKANIISIDSINTQTQRIAEELQKITEDINIASKGIEHICPLCHSVITNDKKNEIVAEKQKRITGINEEKIKLEKNLVFANENNTKIKETIKSLSETKSRLEDEVLTYEENELREIENNVVEYKNNLISLKKEYDEKNNSNKEIKTRIEELNEKIMDLPKEPQYTQINLKDIVSARNSIENEITSQKNNIKILEAQAKSIYDKRYIISIEETIKNLEAEQVLLKNTFKNVQKNVLHHDTLLRILSNKDDGFKKHIINKMIGTLNDKVNFFLPFFFGDELQITFDKELNETIIKDDEVVDFQTLSSGQKTESDLAVAFALFSIVRIFFNSSVNFMVLDEILDRNLDVDGVNAVVDILNALSDGLSIMVVSHREEYKERFKRSIRIKMNDDKLSEIA